MRSLDELVAQGEALIEARRRPEKGRTMFEDFGDAYRRWYIAGRELLAGLAGPSAERDWDAGMCNGMYSLTYTDAFLLKHHERQQGMLVELRARLRSHVGSGAGPGGSESALRAGQGAAQAAGGTDKGDAPSGRAVGDVDRLYALKPDARHLTDEELLQDMRAAAKALGKTTITRAEYQHQRRSSSMTFARRFGSWNKALAAAGLAVVARKNIPTQALFENLARVWQAVGRQPVESDMVKPQSEYSSGPYRARYGAWREALKAFVAWAGEGKSLEEHAASPATPAPENSRVQNVRLRFDVLQRDSFKCTACGRSPASEAGVKLHVDHKIPWSRGGRTTLDNLTTLCEKCNLGKGNI